MRQHRSATGLFANTRNVDPDDGTELRESFTSQRFNYDCRILMVAFSIHMHPAVNSWNDNITPSADGLKQSSGLHARFVDGCHCFQLLRQRSAATPR